MRVLGIDPGTLRTGWGVVERSGNVVRSLGAGVIRTRDADPLERRLAVVFEGLVAVVEEHAPDEVAVEDVFFSKHANAALKLGHARGVALLAAARAGLTVTAYPPAVVKRAIGGHGAAEKSQIAQMVRAILGLSALPPPDATDALAIAVTHVHAMRAPALARSKKR